MLYPLIPLLLQPTNASKSIESHQLARQRNPMFPLQVVSFFKFKIDVDGFIVNVLLLFKMVCTHFFLVCLDTFFKCLVFSCAQLKQNNWHCSSKRCLIFNSFLSIVFEVLFQSFCGISAASNWHGTRLE